MSSVHRKQEERSHWMCDAWLAAPVMMAIVTAEEGRFVEANNCFVRMSGYSRDEIVGRTVTECREMISPSRWRILKKALQEKGALSGRKWTWWTRTGTRYESFLSAEICTIRDRSCFVLVLQKSDGNGKPAEKHNERTSFPKGEEKYRSLVENINEVVYSLDADARITYVSPNIKQLGGYDRSEVLGRPFTDFVHREDIPGRVEQFRKIQTGEGEATEYRMVTKSGEMRWVRTAARPIFVNGVPSGVRGVLMDITDRIAEEEKKEEQEKRLLYERKMEAVGALAGGVAHDLNNVLTGLVSLPELILMQVPDDSPIKGPLRTIKKSGEKAAAMVQDLLTLARRGVAITGRVDLNEIIREYMKTPEYGLLVTHHPHVRFKVNLNPDLLDIMGSSIHLSKTVMNLLSNAAEAIASDGDVLISTENRYVEQYSGKYCHVKEGEYVVLTVSDTGAGMSAVDMEHIFEPFYTKKILGRSGTGLGMSVVWGCVQDHKSAIDVDSEEGRGTLFTLYFPAVQKAPVEPAHQRNEEIYKGRGEPVLVVDDVAEQREIACMILASLGYRAFSVAGGEAAVEYLKKSHAKVILLDMIMDPGIDGLETCKRLFARNPDQKIIIVSGYSESAQVKEALRIGARGYVRKPYRIETLAAAVRKALGTLPL